MFKKGGRGLKGVLTNVQKKCKTGRERHPLRNLYGALFYSSYAHSVLKRKFSSINVFNSVQNKWLSLICCQTDGNIFNPSIAVLPGLGKVLAVPRQLHGDDPHHRRLAHSLPCRLEVMGRGALWARGPDDEKKVKKNSGQVPKTQDILQGVWDINNFFGKLTILQFEVNFIWFLACSAICCCFRSFAGKIKFC